MKKWSLSCLGHAILTPFKHAAITAFAANDPKPAPPDFSPVD